MTFREYLEGLFEQGVFTDANFNSIFTKWGVESGDVLLEEVGERERDLCEAELCLLVANRSNGSGETIERGNFRISERTWNMTWADKDRFLNRAWRLFKKWGEEDQEDGEEFHYKIGERY